MNQNNSSLSQIIIGCRKQKLGDQEKLYHTYKKDLYNLALKYSRNTEDAEDILHDAFIVIFKTIRKYKETGSFEGWMKRIVIFKAIDRYKLGKSKHQITDQQAQVDEEEFDTGNLFTIDEILQVVQELPDQYRLVFNLYQMDGFSHKEIADSLGITVGTSKSNLSRSKKILSQKLTDLRNNKQY
ncbi:RNA polymerase sigma factor [Nonlabens marinus]|uniref:RNA polymerase ECF-type sigma factor n=1 Tax=Nonlabens marinus S1-08 TaxID=1454201 RepID=W8W0N8_9FLAO|nr:sigma-70 family RNA polymerase sigma factor [Nonlabens marinus]BAO56651.1 RNA polymerase ECF-type sigma factor [Nonlabens marinus S1-08]